MSTTAETILNQHKSNIYVRTDRLFAKLLIAEYFIGILGAYLISPRTWIGEKAMVEINLIAAMVVGAIIVAIPLALIYYQPGKTITRQVIAVSQMLISILWIHFSGGRMETHFHIFGSLAFLAFYRDWRVLLTASVVISLDHFVRGIYWPLSVYGVETPSSWRWLEHTGWFIFEDVILWLAIRQSDMEMRSMAERQADLNQKEISLKKSEREFRSIFELSGTGKFELDARTGRFLRVNKKFTSILGYSKEECLQMTLFDILPNDETNEQLHVFQSLILGDIQDWVGKHQYRRQDGTTFWALVSAAPIRDADGTVTIVANMSDIDALIKAESDLVEAKTKAEDANRAKSAFLANMSHEIRTPLGAMIGFTEIMLDEKDLTEQDREKHLKTILRNGEQLYRIIDDILDISKIEANKMEIENVQFPLKDVIEDVTSLLGLKAREKGLDLIVHQHELPDTIETDPVRLRQILMNIVGNAVKFTDNGKVEIDFRMKKLDSRSILEIKVSDTGLGIAEEKRSKLFQPFSQVDNVTSRRFGGTGLGLYLSLNLARRLGGDIWLDKSVMGVGSTFVITIDAGKVAYNQGGVSMEIPSSQPNAKPLGGFRVLVVDDLWDNLDLTSRFLKMAGAEAVCVDRAVKAIDILNSEEFDVVLMDIQMPEMDGYDAVRKLRELKYDKPVVALTAHAMKGERERCIEAGFDGYLMKPINKAKLVQTISAFSNRRNLNDLSAPL